MNFDKILAQPLAAPVQAAPHTGTRVLRLDVLRGGNIAAMIVYHYIIFYYPQPSTPLAAAIHWMGAYVGPLFLFLSGAGLAFFFQKHSAATLAKRGLFLFLLATAISVGFKGRFEIEWTLFQVIGLGYIIFAGLGRFTRYRFAGAAALFVLGGALIAGLDIHVGGVFPVFPFIVHLLVGYGYAEVCPTGPGEPASSRTMGAVSAPLLALAVWGFGSALLTGTRLEWIPSLALQAALFMTLYFIFVRLLYGWTWQHPVGEYLLLLGRVSLTAYYLQQVLLRGLQAAHLNIVVLDSFVSYVLLVLAVSGMVYGILRLWQSLNFTFTLEWWMRRL